ncbi:MAG: hypothetical protein ACJ72L_14475 [Marmoricola sp.]
MNENSEQNETTTDDVAADKQAENMRISGGGPEGTVSQSQLRIAEEGTDEEEAVETD